MRYYQNNEGRFGNVFRVSRVQESACKRASCSTFGDRAPRSGVQEAGRAQSSQAGSKTEAEAARRFPRPSRSASALESFRFSLLPDQLLIGQAATCDLGKGRFEAVVITDDVTFGILPIVVAESLFVYVAEQMKRLDRNVGSADATFQAGPKILDAVGVDVAVHVSFGMVDDLVIVLGQGVIVGRGFIGVYGRSGFDIFFDILGERLALGFADHFCGHFAVALKQPLNGGLANGTASLPAHDFRFPALVHVPGLAADEGFVHFNLTAKFAAVASVL